MGKGTRSPRGGANRPADKCDNCNNVVVGTCIPCRDRCPAKDAKCMKCKHNAAVLFFKEH